MFNQLVSALATKIRGNFVKDWLSSISICVPIGRRDVATRPGGPRRDGGVVQVETRVESARFQHLKLNYKKLLSNVAFT